LESDSPKTARDRKRVEPSERLDWTHEVEAVVESLSQLPEARLWHQHPLLSPAALQRRCRIYAEHGEWHVGSVDGEPWGTLQSFFGKDAPVVVDVNGVKGVEATDGKGTFCLLSPWFDN